jgi:hypothetical protein
MPITEVTGAAAGGRPPAPSPRPALPRPRSSTAVKLERGGAAAGRVLLLLPPRRRHRRCRRTSTAVSSAPSPSSKAAALLPLHRRGRGRDAASSSGALVDGPPQGGNCPVLLNFAVLILLLIGFGDELCSFDVWKLPLFIELVDGSC